VRLEQIGETTLYGKTGWRGDSTPQLGWWVGWVERGGRISCFALNIDFRADADADKRVPLGKDLLGRLGVLP
jgi:beta-lactamase class D